MLIYQRRVKIKEKRPVICELFLKGFNGTISLCLSQNRVPSVCQRATESHQRGDGEGGGYPLSGERLVMSVCFFPRANTRQPDKKE